MHPSFQHTFLICLIFHSLSIHTFHSQPTSNYKVPSYIGYYNKNFFNYDNLTTNRLVYFQLHDGPDQAADLIVYPDPLTHTLHSIGPSSYTLLAGAANFSGHRLGKPLNSLLNGPTAVCIQPSNQTRLDLFNSMKLYLVTSQDCNISDPFAACLIRSRPQYHLSFANLLFYPQIDANPNAYNTRSIQITSQDIYISDTQNHCIKVIDSKTQTVQVVAGKCGTSGFLDGPKGINRLNKPRAIGVTPDGVVYFFDSGNEYMRQVKGGVVRTLLNGACTFLKQSRRLMGKYSVKTVMCYEDWLENSGNLAAMHMYDQSKTTSMCKLQYSQCLA